MIVTTTQYFVILGQLSVQVSSASPKDATRTYTWIPYGPFADQTECVKMLMLGTYQYDEMKIIKCQLPLLLKPDHATVAFDDIAEDAPLVELEDEPSPEE